jgi:hypothetical protein
VRAPEPERVMMAPPVPVADVTPSPVVAQEIILNSKDEVKSELSSEEQKPTATTNCVWEGFNIDDKITDKLKTNTKQADLKQ